MALFRKLFAGSAVVASLASSCEAVMLKGSTSTSQSSDLEAGANDDDGFYTPEYEDNFDRLEKELLETMERHKREFEEMKNRLRGDNQEERTNYERDASELLQDDNESPEQSPLSNRAAASSTSTLDQDDHTAHEFVGFDSHATEKGTSTQTLPSANTLLSVIEGYLGYSAGDTGLSLIISKVRD